jgi:hypothetical protein
MTGLRHHFGPVVITTGSAHFAPFLELFRGHQKARKRPVSWVFPAFAGFSEIWPISLRKAPLYPLSYGGKIPALRKISKQLLRHVRFLSKAPFPKSIRSSTQEVLPDFSACVHEFACQWTIADLTLNNEAKVNRARRASEIEAAFRSYFTHA